MKRLLYLISFVSLVVFPLLFSSCEKMDNESSLIEIFAEPLNRGAKVMVDGNEGTWVDGDKICINGDRLAVEHHGGHAYIPYASPASVNRAVYPADIATASLATDETTVTFPAIYHFKTDGSGHQLLELPMAARSTGSNPLEFKHLTGALCFVVHNNGSVPLRLQSLIVKSDKYKLCGTRTVDFSNIESYSIVTDIVADRQIRMLFDTSYVLPAGNELNVMLPIAPVGSDNHFTVELRSHVEDATSSLLYSHTQPATEANRSLLRNQLGYAGVDITNTTGGNIVAMPLLETNDVAEVYVYSPHDFFLWHSVVNGKNVIFQGRSQTYWETPCKIMVDIDMTGYSFTPIMDYRSTLNGNNHTISNLTLESCEEPVSSPCHICGLFYKHNDMTISNLVLDNLNLKHIVNASRNLFMGSLFAITDENSEMSVSGCTIRIGSVIVTGTVSDGFLYFGGLVGQLTKVATFSDCHVTTPSNTLSARNIYWGGLVGYDNNKSLNISNSSWGGVGTISAKVNLWAGGLVGRDVGGNFTAENCEVEGSINATYEGGSYHLLASLIGKYDSPATYNTSGTTSAVTLSLNGVSVTPVDYN